MQRIILAISIAISMNATAETATEIGKAIGGVATSQQAQDAARAFTDTTQATMWQSVCNGTGNLSHSAHCYMTPSGKRAWEYPEGPERLYWLKIGKEAHKRHIQQKWNQRKQDAAHAERMYKANKMNSQLCSFWQDQDPSERRTQKTKEHCG